MLLLYVLAPLCLVALLIRRLYKFRNYPNAPGPGWAKYTRWWYLKKVYEGKFEQWDVDQHARHGMQCSSPILLSFLLEHTQTR